MPAKCKTCSRKDVHAINELLVGDTSLRKIMAKFAGLSAGGLQRHKENCIRDLFQGVIEEKRAGLLCRVDEMRAEIQEVKAAFIDNPNVRIGIIGKIRDAADLEAKLTGAYINPADNPADLKSVARTVAEFRQRIATDAEIYAATNGKYGHPMPDDSFVEAEIGKLLKTHKVLPEQLATEMGKIG